MKSFVRWGFILSPHPLGYPNRPLSYIATHFLVLLAGKYYLMFSVTTTYANYDKSRLF